MRIPGNHGNIGIEPPKAPGRRGAAQGGGDAGGAADETDEVRLSAQGVALSRETDPGFDAAKVARLRSSIDAGTFRVDVREIAERLARGG